ncbi:MAG: 30S ribosomal protein S10 [Mycoplasmataceae bacterium RV_VA103A]|nr:MAG: 30S ribosomal protein S10 [Mycoplasmataceae bacterium RV_VA103A]
MKKSNKLNIIIEGFEVPLVEITTAWIVRKLLNAKLKFTGKIYLPTKREVVTPLRSPHKHKDSQEHLGRMTYRRLIQVVDASFADLNKAGLAGSYPQISRGVQVRVKV